MIHDTGFNDTFYYFGNERQIWDWPVVGQFFFIHCCFQAKQINNRISTINNIIHCWHCSHSKHGKIYIAVQCPSICPICFVCNRNRQNQLTRWQQQKFTMTVYDRSSLTEAKELHAWKRPYPFSSKPTTSSNKFISLLQLLSCLFDKARLQRFLHETLNTDIQLTMALYSLWRYINCLVTYLTAFSTLTHWLGNRKGIWPVKNWMVGCWRGYLSGARCRLAYDTIRDAILTCARKPT